MLSYNVTNVLIIFTCFIIKSKINKVFEEGDLELNNNQSCNKCTSDRPHWLRKLLRMAKVFSAKSLDLYVP